MNQEERALMQAPDTAPRFRLYPEQWIGLPFLILIPVLALFGVFGETSQHVEARGSEIELKVDYLARYRYRQIGKLEVHVRNTTNRKMDTVTVAFDSRYVQQFSSPVLVPAPQIPFEVVLTDVLPDETRLVWAELEAGAFGIHSGSIRAYGVGPDTVSVQIRTTIFP
jgi:hypothetical protein